MAGVETINENEKTFNAFVRVSGTNSYKILSKSVDP